MRLKVAIPKETHITILDIIHIIGMRSIEVHRLYDHKEWYNEKRSLIHLPESAIKKQKRG